MEFDKTRVYTPFNADEVKVGSKGFVADNKTDLMTYVNRSNGQDLIELKDVDSAPGSNLPFVVGIGCNTVYYEYFYLVEEPTMKEKQLTMYELNQLLKCFGVECYANNTFIYNDVLYEHNDSNKEISVNYKIRYKQGEWEEPTRETVFKWWCKDNQDSDIARLVSFFGWDVGKE